MDRKIRILGIAPYEGMKSMMISLEEEYPQIELTVLVGDRDQGVKIAQQNFHGNYDVVISRGATARMLQQLQPLPVIAVDISMYDILCALQLSSQTDGRIAVVSFLDINESIRQVRDLTGRNIDVFTIESTDAIEPTLLQIQQAQYDLILCDVIVDSTAKRMSMYALLITSGVDSIRHAFDQALLLCQSQTQLKGENLFLRNLLNSQISQTIVFDENGNIYLSTVENASLKLLDLLRSEIPESLKEPERRIIRSLNGIIYTIRSKCIFSNNITYIAFLFTSRKTPLSPGKSGIRFSSCQEAENEFYDSLICLSSSTNDYQEQIAQINRSQSPVIISGEDGTGKESIVHMIYTRSPLRNAPLVTINCSLLNDKSWNFIFEHSSSPLAGEGNTLYFSSIDTLSKERQKQLLDALAEMKACQRNRIIFSCVCQPGEQISAAGAAFLNTLCCLSIYLPSLRQQREQIPALLNLYLNHLNVGLPRPIIGAEPEAIALLQDYPWPHNYTQFQRVIRELAVTSSGSIITATSVSAILGKEQHSGAFSPQAENASTPLNLNRTLSEIDRDIAARVVQETGGNQTAAAKRLGISRTTLWRLLQK